MVLIDIIAFVMFEVLYSPSEEKNKEQLQLFLGA